MDLHETMFYGQSAYAWLIAGGVALGVTVLLLLMRNAAVARLKRSAERTATLIDDFTLEVLRSARVPFIAAVGTYLAIQLLEFPPRAAALTDKAIIVVVLLQVALWGNRGIKVWLHHQVSKQMEADAAGATTVSVLGFVARIALWATVALMILDNLGVNITALVASLGIGGIAVALAAQNVLGDLFASLSIALDKPFVIGDFITVGDELGTVEHIGLKTTRLRSLTGEQIIFSNADLLGSRVRNYKRMTERRVLFRFGLVYDTPADKLERVPTMLRTIIEAQSLTRFDRAHFISFGDSSLDFEVVYFVLDRGYNVYMDVQQAINLEMVRRFQAEGLEFAFPTRTVHVASVPRASAP